MLLFFFHKTIYYITKEHNQFIILKFVKFFDSINHMIYTYILKHVFNIGDFVKFEWLKKEYYYFLELFISIY